MKLIDSSVSIIPYTDPYTLIETVGRTCYKSESKMTSGSSQKFVDSLINNKHFAMLEHARITFKFVQSNKDEHMEFNHLINFYKWAAAFQDLPKAYVYDYDSSIIVSVTMSHLYNTKWDNLGCGKYLSFLRQIFKYSTSIVEYQRPDLLLGDTTVEVLSNDTINETTCGQYWRSLKTLTARFICDRGVSHEIIRHRVALSQESQRYCDYSSGKFNHELTFIKPSGYDTWSVELKQLFDQALTTSEHAYLELRKLGLKPQQCRGTLVNAAKTEVMFTATYTEWDHFFGIRLFGLTGIPHPDVQALAEKLLTTIQSNPSLDYSYTTTDMSM